MKALKDINYDGTFSLEADGFLKKFPPELYEDGLAFMAKVARHLADKF
jgi:sugar phosphate isomerase/epimerase